MTRIWNGVYRKRNWRSSKDGLCFYVYHDEMVFFLYHGKEFFLFLLFTMIYAVFMSYHGKKKVLSSFITMRGGATMISHGKLLSLFLLFE